MWSIKCITYGWLIGIMIIKECSSGRNKITHNKGIFSRWFMPKTNERI